MKKLVSLFCFISLSIVVLTGCQNDNPKNKKAAVKLKYHDLKPPPSVDSINISVAIKDVEKFINAKAQQDSINTYYEIYEIASIPFLKGRYFLITNPHVIPSPEETIVFYKDKVMPIFDKRFSFNEALKYDDKFTKKNVDSLINFILKEYGDYRVVNDVLEIPGIRDRYFENPLIISPRVFKKKRGVKYISCYSWSPYSRNIYKLTIEMYPDSSNISFIKSYKDKVGWESTVEY